MSSGSHLSSVPQHDCDLLADLLHSLSQPLTSLRCSLELSVDESPGKHRNGVSRALQNTEQVIGMIQLMREYLDAQQPASRANGPRVHETCLAPTLRSVIEELSSIAGVRNVRLRLVGTCAATVPLPESRLRLALQYLVASMIESQPEGGGVQLLLGQGPAGAVLRAEVESSSASQPFPLSPSLSPLRRVRLAIAARVLESAGASLVFQTDNPAGTSAGGFVLRIPRHCPSGSSSL